MSKKCTCDSPVPNFDGTCTSCGKLLNWDKNLDWLAAAGEEAISESIPFKMPNRSAPKADLSGQLRNSANEVVRFSKVFKSIGDTLNVLNYIFIGISVVGLLLLLFAGATSGWLFIGAILVVLIVWVISWIQTGLLRGISSFFLMRGLRELKDLEDN
jgi:type IV secretory pathway VirB6-like protein